jgi:hypothetical protein
MPPVPQHDELAEILPGTWIVRASNFPMWLSGERESPRFTYGLVAADPLTLDDDVSYVTKSGETKHIVGIDRWAHTGFVWRGKGLMRLLSSRWSVIGADDSRAVVAIRFEKTLATPAGIDILVRDGHDIDEVRTLVARNTEQFGLSAEDFASVTWLA